MRECKLQNENCKMQNGKLPNKSNIVGADTMTPDELAERLLDFAVRVGKVVNALPANAIGTAYRRAIGPMRDVAGPELRGRLCGGKPG